MKFEMEGNKRESVKSQTSGNPSGNPTRIRKRSCVLQTDDAEKSEKNPIFKSFFGNLFCRVSCFSSTDFFLSIQQLCKEIRISKLHFRFFFGYIFFFLT